MRLFPILTAAAFSVLPVWAQEAAMPSDADIAKILSDRIGRDQANIGIAVAVIEDGETRFVSHGTTGVDDATPITENTLFEAGSITKAFTGLLLSQLALDGLIDLDAPISDYLPAGTILPQNGEQVITARLLATHRAGLTSLPDAVMSRGVDNPYSGVGRDALFNWLATASLARPVGSGFEYSNVGAALLGVAMEEVTGQNYSSLVKDRILSPLQMDNSYIATTGEVNDNLPKGHDPTKTQVANWDFDVFAPAGGLVTTARDLAKFIAAASGNSETDLAAAFANMLVDPVALEATQSVGLGWLVTDVGQGDIVWHNGSTAGFRSFAGYEAMSGNGVVVLSNMVTQAGIDDIGMHLLNPSLPLREQPKPRTAVEIDSSVLQSYVGVYELAPGVVFDIREDAGKLYAQLTGQQSFEILPESETAFFYQVVDAQISFVVEGGKAVALVLHQNGADQRAERVD